MIDNNHRLDIRHRKVLAAIEDYGSFLEVGPGNAKCSLYLLRKSKDVEMIDIDTDNMRNIEEICNREGLKFVFFNQNILTFRTERKYEVVFACQVIEHIEPWKQAVRSMIDLATKAVILTTPVGNSFHSPDHKHFFKPIDFDWLKAEFGKRMFIYTTPTKPADIDRVKYCFVVEIYK